MLTIVNEHAAITRTCIGFNGCVLSPTKRFGISEVKMFSSSHESLEASHTILCLCGKSIPIINYVPVSLSSVIIPKAYINHSHIKPTICNG